MNDWLILAILIVIGAIIIVLGFAFVKEGDGKNPRDDDDDEILGI